ncbi:immunoglobulin domain-containing protein [Roseateles sp. DB2]|uniref:immunoglobulin domain-containing protein n=1 Tax=Roseateles sp. DB2 TaxID=3453717 RepID=UPI003EE919B1
MPNITRAPEPVTVSDGSPAAFTVEATGSKPLTFQWLRNGQPILGAVDASLTLAKVELADSGASYAVRVSNAGGDTISSAAALKVNPVSVKITSSPVDLTVPDGSNASFSVVASGSGTLTYQWFANGVAIPGAVASSYNMVASHADNGKTFSVTVNSPYGAALSTPAKLSVSASPPRVPKDMKTVSARVGEPLFASVVTSGTPPFSYQWERSDDGGATWQAISGSTGSDFRVEKSTLAWANAMLRVRVTNEAGTAVTAPVLVNVQAQVRILAGDTGGLGYADGVGADARFGNERNNLTVGRDGVIYVADRAANVIRAVRPDGTTSTVAGIPGAYFEPRATMPQVLGTPRNVGLDSFGRLVYSTYNGTYRIGSDPVPERLDALPSSRLSKGEHLIVDADDSVLMTDFNGDHLYRLIPTKGVVVLIDRINERLRGQIRAVALDSQRNIYVAAGRQIWRLDVKTNTRSLWLGSGSYGCSKVGQRLTICQDDIYAMAFDPEDKLYFWNNSGQIYKVDQQGNTNWLAGSKVGDVSEVDGPGSLALVPTVVNFAWHPAGYIVFASENGTIRTIDANGTVRTIAGKSPYIGRVTVFGPGRAQFYPGVLRADPRGYVLMNGSSYGTVQIDRFGVMTDAASSLPHGIKQWMRDPDGKFVLHHRYSLVPSGDGRHEDPAGRWWQHAFLRLRGPARHPARIRV